MSEEQYRAAARELAGTGAAKNAFAATGVSFDEPVAPERPKVFDLGDAAGHALRQSFGVAVAMGNVSENQVSVQLAGNATAQSQSDKRKREEDEKRRFQDRLHQLLLDRLSAVRAEMQGMEDELRGLYGDDFIGGMAARYLTEEELAGAQTDDERLAALARVFLDENGNIKPEYANDPAARYVAKWKEEQRLEGDVRDYPNMNSEERAAVGQRLRATSAVHLNRTDGLSENAELDQIAEQAVDETSVSVERESASVPLPFA